MPQIAALCEPVVNGDFMTYERSRHLYTHAAAFAASTGSRCAVKWRRNGAS